MSLENTQIKFVQSGKTGELIGFVSINPKTRKLKGVREDSMYGKKICVLSEDLKGKIEPNVLYDCELKKMHNKNGYVVTSAVRTKIRVIIETVTVPLELYKVILTFGYKTIYYDPIGGRTDSSKTVDGVIALLKERNDIADINSVIEEFKMQAQNLNTKMKQDGYH